MSRIYSAPSLTLFSCSYVLIFLVFAWLCQPSNCMWQHNYQNLFGSELQCAQEIYNEISLRFLKNPIAHLMLPLTYSLEWHQPLCLYTFGSR